MVLAGVLVSVGAVVGVSVVVLMRCCCATPALQVPLPRPAPDRVVVMVLCVVGVGSGGMFGAQAMLLSLARVAVHVEVMKHLLSATLAPQCQRSTVGTGSSL